MIINFINESSEAAKIYIQNLDKEYVIDTSKQQIIEVYDEVIHFSISSNGKSSYGEFVSTKFNVLTKYEIKNNHDMMTFHIVKRECSDARYAQYIKLIVLEEYFTKILNYSVSDKEELLKKEKKRIRLGHLISLFTHFLSFVNLCFGAIGVAISSVLGIKIGIICYILLFSIYFIISETLFVIPDKKILLKNFIDNEYIKFIFDNE